MTYRQTNCVPGCFCARLNHAERTGEVVGLVESGAHRAAEHTLGVEEEVRAVAGQIAHTRHHMPALRLQRVKERAILGHDQNGRTRFCERRGQELTVAFAI